MAFLSRIKIDFICLHSKPPHKVSIRRVVKHLLLEANYSIILHQVQQALKIY